MSRHRDVRNINLEDELDDDALSDGGEEEMTAEQQLQMNDAFERIRDTLGEEGLSEIPDSEIKDAIWYYHFDIEQSLDWCLHEQEKRRAAKLRQGGFEPTSPVFPYNEPVGPNGDTMEERPRIPLIHLAQWEETQRRLDAMRQEELEDSSDEESPESSTPKPSRKLSTISERTERTEFSPYWPNRQLAPPRAPSSTTGTSYGEVINTGTFAPVDTADPNHIPVSPSLSAQQRLSVYEPAPSVPTSGSRSSTSSPRPPSEPVPPLDTIPDIPDVNSKSTRPTAHKPEAKQSKLSLLASSRASTRSKSSASLGTENSGSIKTYPGLRPSAQSARVPGSSVQSYVSEKSLPPLPPSTLMRDSTIRSSTDSHIRRAIQTAIAQEEKDRSGSEQSSTVTESRTSVAPSTLSTSTASKAPTSPSSKKPPSKLALLAQAKAGKPVIKPKGPLDTKLTSSPPVLPPERTEYLTPIANGSSVTTAITTSYQSLYSLTDPNRPPTSPTPYVVPLSAAQSSTSPSKPSKLALKSRKTKEKQIVSADVEEKAMVPTVPDIFIPKSSRSPAREREKAQKRMEAAASRTASPIPKGKKGPKTPVRSGTATPLRGLDQRALDLSALNLTEKEETPQVPEEPPKVSFAREKLLEEAKKVLDAEGSNNKKTVSLVVIGHVDAGKSTLMGRLLYELGRLDEKTRAANERGSTKVGKSSFSWAWSLDGTTEERERGITMDIALQSMTTPHRHITILDAPGHKDFIPNMISGAAQADCALLVVDASTGEFEAGFNRGGQTREHIVLVRSLGVSQVIIAVNKLDQVNWDKDRYDEIVDFIRPFLTQSGFQSSKTKFVPVSAMQGINLTTRGDDASKELRSWYEGPSLVDYLDQLEPPTRDIYAPLRIPISNVFKGQGAGVAVSGRLCGGVVQVGDRLSVLPGDESAVVKTIELEEESVQWAAAGSNVTIYLTSIDPVHLNIGSVLCYPSEPVPLATIFTARIIVFDIQVPITSGTSVELFHHSRDVSATIASLIATLDRTTGEIVKKKPRVLTKGSSAEVQIVLRTTSMSGPSVVRPVPLEPFSANKDMGRILLRRGGETIGAGIVLEIFG